jgi:hypothetical protein
LDHSFTSNLHLNRFFDTQSDTLKTALLQGRTPSANHQSSHRNRSFTRPNTLVNHQSISHSNRSFTRSNTLVNHQSDHLSRHDDPSLSRTCRNTSPYLSFFEYRFYEPSNLEFHTFEPLLTSFLRTFEPPNPYKTTSTVPRPRTWKPNLHLHTTTALGAPSGIRTYAVRTHLKNTLIPISNLPKLRFFLRFFLQFSVADVILPRMRHLYH